jgi:putative chitinase
MLAAMHLAEINSILRTAHWLAQIGHETGRLRYAREVWGPTPAQSRYEPNTTLSKKLGNTRKGDGFKYRGAGDIQVTGGDNFRAFTRRFKSSVGSGVPDFGQKPELLARIEWSSFGASDYWISRNLNQFADANDTYMLTKRINGGSNGLADRTAILTRAIYILEG